MESDRAAKLLYEMLVLRRNFQQFNFWLSNLKGVKDIVVFQEVDVFVKGRKVYDLETGQGAGRAFGNY